MIRIHLEWIQRKMSLTLAIAEQKSKIFEFKNKYNGHFYVFPNRDFYLCMKYMVLQYQISMESALGYIYIENVEKLRPVIKMKKNILSDTFFPNKNNGREKA